MHFFLQFRISQSCSWWAEDVIPLVSKSQFKLVIVRVLSVCYVLCLLCKTMYGYDLFRCHVFFLFSLSFPLPLVSHLSVCLKESACHCHFNFYYEYKMRFSWTVLLSGVYCAELWSVVCLHVEAQCADMSISKPLLKHLKLWMYL